MNLSLYSGASGMEGQQVLLNTIANNIANVNSTGFKRNKVEFQDMLYQTTRESGADAGGGNTVPTSVEMGNGTKVVSTSKIFSQGTLTQTDSEFDLAIEGEGFFEVERPDGSVAYTRDGGLKRDSEGRIVTNAGYPLAGGFQALPSDAASFSVSDTGDVTVLNASGEILQQYRVQLVRFTNPGGLKALGGNLYLETGASGTPEAGNPAENGFGAIRQQYLEMSNVDVVQEMVNMIIAQRSYEISSKSIQVSDEMLSRVNQLKR